VPTLSVGNSYKSIGIGEFIDSEKEINLGSPSKFGTAMSLAVLRQIHGGISTNSTASAQQ